MLAQSFMSAADLGLTDAERSALITVLGMLERGDIQQGAPGETVRWYDLDGGPVAFNMKSFFGTTECGTVACICGWAISVGNLGRDLMDKRFDRLGLLELFEARTLTFEALKAITTDQAARALRNYLTFGEPKWTEAVA